jgi:hypothetical protein
MSNGVAQFTVIRVCNAKMCTAEPVLFPCASPSLFSAPCWKLLQCSPQSCFWHSRSSSRLCEGKGGRPCNAEETGLGDWENLEGSTGGGGVGGRTQTRADSAGDENPFDREHLQLIVTDSNSAIVIFVWFFVFSFCLCLFFWFGLVWIFTFPGYQSYPSFTSSFSRLRGGN